MKLFTSLIIVFICIYSLNTASASLSGSFSSYSPQKKLYAQSVKTYEMFKNDLIKIKLQTEAVSPKDTSRLEEKLTEAGLANRWKITSNPQEQLGKLAFLYTAMNRADLNAALTIDRICTAEYFMKPSENPNVCNTYSKFLVKLVELRISVITSQILFSKGLLGIPKNWVSHVQTMASDLDTAGMLSESLRQTLTLLLGVAGNIPEIDTAVVSNILGPKSLSPQIDPPGVFKTSSDDVSGGINDKRFTGKDVVAPPVPQKITIDARNIAGSNARSKADSTLSQIIPNMIMF